MEIEKIMENKCKTRNKKKSKTKLKKKKKLQTIQWMNTFKYLFSTIFNIFGGSYNIFAVL